MLKRPLIVGCRGVMGRRYSAIFKSLGVDFLGVDQGEKIPAGFDSLLLATPTECHLSDIECWAGSGLPILCEKPLATDPAAVLKLLDQLADYPLRMVNQYEYLPNGEGGITEYNYWNHGKDSLAWDCINIIGMAKGEVLLGEDSPVWRCFLNGREQVLCDMDHAYIAMLMSWLSGEVSNVPYIRHAHEKVAEYSLCKRAS